MNTAGGEVSYGEGKAADLILVDATAVHPRLITAISNGNVASILKYA